MAQAISAILALLLGFVTWSFAAALSKGVYPLGSAGMLEAVVFYAPIVGFVIPAAIRSFDSKSPVSGMWLLALGPIAGILNFIPFMLLYALSMMALASPSAEVVPVGLLVGVWGLVLYRQVRPRTPDVKSDSTGGK